MVLFLIAAPLIMVASGCASGSPFGRRISDFRAYYNAFYNAQRAFEEGERAATASTAKIDRSQFLTLYPRQEGAGAQQFRDAVDKSIEMLRKHPESRWVDDALLLVGKGYFYQGNFVGADQKFGEAIETATARGNTRLADEARVWRGRTLAALQRYEEAVEFLSSALERPDVDRRVGPHLHLVLGDVYVRSAQWSEAAAALEVGLREIGSAEPAARAQFLLGQVLEANGQYAEAAQAYDQVGRLRPVYELEYAALLQRALVLGLDVGDHAAAGDLLSRMRRDDRHRPHLAEVAVSHARVLAAAGQNRDAQALFRAVLYDQTNTYRLQDIRGEAYLRYAEFHRDHLGDFVRASAYLDTAATAIRTPQTSGLRQTRAAPRDVARQAAVFASYATLARQVAEVDSLLMLGSLDDDALEARLRAIDDARIAEARERIRREERMRADAAFAAGGAGPARPGGATQPEQGSAAAGFLGYMNPVMVQEGRLGFQRVWGDRPLAENWRRGRAIGQAVVENPLSDPLRRAPQATISVEDFGLEPLDIARIPRTIELQDEFRAERAFLRYELGNVLFLSMNRLDEARRIYQTIIDEDTDIAVFAQTVYALAELEREAGNDDIAEPLYNLVIEDDPGSSLADQSRERLGLPPIDAPVDETARAERQASAAYDAAFAHWQTGNRTCAFAHFLDTAERHPESMQAPRSLLAASVVYSEMARKADVPIETPFNTLLASIASNVTTEEASVESNDAEDLSNCLLLPPDAPIDLADLYSRIVDAYPGTPFATRAERLQGELTIAPAAQTPGGEDAAIAEEATEATTPAVPAQAQPRDESDPHVVSPGTPEEALGAMGEVPLLPEFGGYTWEMVSLPSPMAARALLENYRRRGYRVGVYREGDLYRLLLGQFENRSAAEAALPELPDAPGGAAPRLLPLRVINLLPEGSLIGE